MSPFVVTKKQAKELKKLGYNGDTRVVRMNNSLIRIMTVDEAIDFLRRKYNIMIYNTSAPFVDPTDKKRRISYSFSVKHCNRRDGWNGRTFIGYTDTSYNIYVVKRRAVASAIAWINKFLKK